MRFIAGTLAAVALLTTTAIAQPGPAPAALIRARTRLAIR